MPSNVEFSDHEGTEEREDRPNGFLRQRNESPHSKMSFSSSQKTPARSYFQHSSQDSHGEIQPAQTIPSILY